MTADYPVIGRCTRKAPVKTAFGWVLPSRYGLYDHDCKACPGYKPRQSKRNFPAVCGHCVYWRPVEEVVEI